MFPKSAAVVIFLLFLIDFSNVLAEGSTASFQDEIKLSCKKYAVEDQILPEDVEAYVVRCVHDFIEPGPLDDLRIREQEEGIDIVPPTDEHLIPAKGSGAGA